MRRTLTCVTIVLLTLALANCGPGLLPPGPPLPGFGPGLEWMLFIIIVAAGGIWFIRPKWVDFFRTNPARRSQASEILRERYAKGEISREEYLRVANDLDQHENVRRG